MSSLPQKALHDVLAHREISHDDMVALMRLIMDGGVSPVMLAALLVGLRSKGETVGEITAAVTVMRDYATRVVVPDWPHFVDIVGTGGDGAQTFNISTATALVVAAAGAKVAKHGNRSVSSKSGSADVLEALGVRLSLTPSEVVQSLHETGLGFMFAPNHHPAMKHVAPVRRELGVRTIFNVLGPLTNPAGARQALIGVFHAEWVDRLAQVMQRLGAHHVLVVYGRDGMDECSLGAPTSVAELKEGVIHHYEITPEQFGLARASRDALRVADVVESKAMVCAALENVPGPARDIVLFNAAVALYAADCVGSIASGVALARSVLESGAARDRLTEFVDFTQRCSGAAT
jgi:anthranilate phosphoribosyltransferase